MRAVPAIAAIFAAAVLLGGCSAVAPYVYHAKEFDRSAANFGKTPKDIEAVGVCYNKQATTAAEVGKLAAAECARYGKVARFRDNKYMVCPLLVPALARYDCVKG